MALRLKLGNYETQSTDSLGRTWVGYFPRMTEHEAWAAGRGLWKMSAERAARQRFALIVGEGLVRAVGEIATLSVHGTPTGQRIALEGHVLPEGHPVRDTWLGRPDPVDNGSQNPIAYCELPEEQPFLLRPCACGCGEDTDRDFKPGHDIRAIQARVRDHFGSSPLTFITWIDTTLADNDTTPGAPATVDRAAGAPVPSRR
ncbi:hypothetical protein [Actinokineospora terrae]|uniref:Uncharacterized protein n=1 Tax=Actinokineospora terrae TaxID=155974 RepID=A0A1H9XAR2_9PSEU|nr:hypothetical protein [Actinokineospora terrae]SES42977.1 hypothetical protein SAMN04487818_113212 [Actinokineospora terrae]